jgi:2-C-methyl-D-erythritol 2,4-cyclodiphosphate synthase
MAGGRKLIIGGVDIPSPKGLEGYSDADVLLHAVADALLGAAALGDIGKHFPNTDPRFKGISSLILLRHVADLLAGHRFAVGNVDATVVLESPKIAPYVDLMRKNIADALRIPPQQISVKATTHESLGSIGAGDGAAAHAVALITTQ